MARALRKMGGAAAAGVAVLAMGTAALADTPGPAAAGAPVQSLLHPAGPQAEELYKAMIFDIYGIIILFVVLSLTILYAIFRFRDRSDGRELPPQVDGNRSLEVGWSLALIAGLFIFLVHPVKAEYVFESVPADPGAVEVKAVGHQWWWEFQYPDLGIVTANELVVPAGRVVRIKATSVDVIHSLGVPRLGGKNDALPGRVTVMWLKADEPGVYQGQCMELCGKSHARMYFRVIAKTDDEFAAWVKARQNPVVAAAGAEARRGQEIFLQKCGVCHTIDGTPARGTIGPNLTMLGARTSIGGGIRENTPESLAQWIRDPQSLKPGAIMPGVSRPGGQGFPPTGLGDSDVAALVAFLEGLR